MALLVGARELGLETSWRFGFVGFGQRADTTPGVVYLDIGMNLKPGVLDHHQESRLEGCAAGLVFQSPELVYNHLLGDWLKRHEEGAIAPGTIWRPTIVTHFDPDWDAATATFLTMELIEHGEFPAYARQLVEFSREVDQGRYTFLPDDPGALYAPPLAYLALQNLKLEGKSMSPEDRLQLGLELIRKILGDILAANGARGIRSASDFLPGKPGTADWANDPRFAGVRELLDAEPAKFKLDSKRATTTKVFLPAADGSGPVPVDGFIAGQPTESVLNKYWVRSTGYPFFVCPYGQATAGETAAAANGIRYPRVIISLDPTFRAGIHPIDLRGLGFALEKAESKARRDANRGIDGRGGSPRFSEGYCDNDDPWYDGRGHQWTIVDSPQSSTVLPYEEIVKIATQGAFWEVPLAEGELALMWVDPTTAIPSERVTTVEPFDGAATILQSYFKESRRVIPLVLPKDFHVTPHVTASGERRLFPPDTSPSLQLIRLKAETGSTLEELLECGRRLIEAVGSRFPDYSIAHVRPGMHFSGAAYVDRLVSALAGSASAIPPLLDLDGDMVRSNDRSIVFQNPYGSSRGAMADSDREIFLYVAFVNESLLNLSMKINDLAPTGNAELDQLDTGSLRKSLIRFQARYYQLEASRNPRGQLLFHGLRKTLHVDAKYTEVLSELDRLFEVEMQLAERRRSRAEVAFQLMLYAVAVFASLQALIAFYNLERTVWSSPAFLGLLWGIVAASILGALWILWYRRPRRLRKHRG